MSQTSPITGVTHPQFSIKVATAAPEKLSSEAQKFVNTLESLIQQIKENPDFFTRVTEATAAHKTGPSATEQVEKEIAKGERQWLGTPKIFQTNSTYNWNRLASPVRSLLRDAALTTGAMTLFIRNAPSAVAPFIPKTPWLAAIPASIGAYRFITQKISNNELKYAMRKFGPNSMKGDFKFHPLMQEPANRKAKLEAYEMLSHQAKNTNG